MNCSFTVNVKIVKSGQTSEAAALLLVKDSVCDHGPPSSLSHCPHPPSPQLVALNSEHSLKTLRNTDSAPVALIFEICRPLLVSR